MPDGTRILINEEITVPTVRVLTVEHQEIGILPIADALHRARTANVDLVLVAPNFAPPVCRLLAPGTYPRIYYPPWTKWTK